MSRIMAKMVLFLDFRFFVLFFSTEILYANDFKVQNKQSLKTFCVYKCLQVGSYRFQCGSPLQKSRFAVIFYTFYTYFQVHYLSFFVVVSHRHRTMQKSMALALVGLYKQFACGLDWKMRREAISLVLIYLPEVIQSSLVCQATASCFSRVFH